MSDDRLIASWRPRIDKLQQEEDVLSRSFDQTRKDGSGLLDFEIGFRLVQCRLEIALYGVSFFPEQSVRKTSPSMESLFTISAKAALDAVELFDDLSISASLGNVKIEDFPEFQKVRDTIEALILRGGAAFFEDDSTRATTQKRLVNVVTDAIEKYAPPDEDYEPLINLEGISARMRNFVSRMFPYSSGTDADRPPYGLEASSEVSTSRIALPLSQAIEFYENEVIPQLLENQDREALSRVRQTLEELKRIAVRPRSRPLITPVGYYTDGLTQFTADGEPLVSISLDATYHTGTNVDRIMELVRDEVTRKLAGTGVLRTLDAELDRLRSLESGVKGSKFFPSLKIDTATWFHRLKHRYPHLNVLTDVEAFSALLDAARRGKRRALKRSVSKQLERGSRQPSPPDLTSLMQN